MIAEINTYLDKLDSNGVPFHEIKRRLVSSVKKSFDENIPKVTIFTVAKNAETTISKTISAVRSQTYSNIEYIVIDGLSDDDTCAIIKQNQDCISYWNSQADSGVADATNLALSLATGKFIFWLSADDWVDPEFIEHGVDCLLKNGASFVYGDLKLMKNGVEQETIFADQDYAVKMGFRMTIATPSVILKTSLFQQYGLLDSQYRVANDYELFLRFLKLGVVGVYCPKLIVYHAFGGLSTIYDFRAFREVRFAAISHGLDPTVAWMYYFFCVFKRGLKRLVNLNFEFR